MEDAAAAGETMTMSDRIRIYVLEVALALSIAGGAGAQAWPAGDYGGRPAVGWWEAVVDALAALFGPPGVGASRFASSAVLSLSAGQGALGEGPLSCAG